jgi:hypothetical protein
MRIKILQFQVSERYILRDDTNILIRIFNFLIGRATQLLYHFDCVMKVDNDYQETARPLEVNDFIQLPNGVRLKVWSVDRFGIVKAKTYKMVEVDLRKYHPIEMYLVYPRVHAAGV